MSKFELSSEAVRDLGKLRRWLQREASIRVADMVEDAIFAGILECERLPMIGHPHVNIRDKSMLFYYVYNYAIIFRRQPDVFVVRVVHGARDMTKLF